VHKFYTIGITNFKHRQYAGLSQLTTLQHSTVGGFNIFLFGFPPNPCSTYPECMDVGFSPYRETTCRMAGCYVVRKVVAIWMQSTSVSECCVRRDSAAFVVNIAAVWLSLSCKVD